MPLAECKICNKRFRGKHSVQALTLHTTRKHNYHAKHNGTSKQPPLDVPERLWTKEDLVSALDQRLHTNSFADERLRVATDFIWRSLSTEQRCRLLGDFFIQQASLMKYNKEEQHEPDTNVVDGEVVSDTRTS